MRSAALKLGMQQHNPPSSTSDEKRFIRDMRVMAQHTLNQVMGRN